MALSLTDVLVRRTSLHYRALDQGLAAAPIAAQLMAGELGWNDARTKAETEAYVQFVAASRRWRDEVPAATAVVPTARAS
jgi:glycerol-3-phosphate dehydrogenase